MDDVKVEGSRDTDAKVGHNTVIRRSFLLSHTIEVTMFKLVIVWLRQRPSTFLLPFLDRVKRLCRKSLTIITIYR